jgi:hypothetical protein
MRYLNSNEFCQSVERLQARLADKAKPATTQMEESPCIPLSSKYAFSIAKLQSPFTTAIQDILKVSEGDMQMRIETHKDCCGKLSLGSIAG